MASVCDLINNKVVIAIARRILSDIKSRRRHIRSHYWHISLHFRPLTQMQRQIHLIRILNALVHRLWLPPRRVLRVVDIGQERRTMVIFAAEIGKFIRFASLFPSLPFVLTCKYCHNFCDSNIPSVCNSLGFHFHRTCLWLPFEPRKQRFRTRECIATNELKYQLSTWSFAFISPVVGTVWLC